MHGTKKDCAEKIAATHNDLSKAKRSLHGPGVYSTPNPAEADGYAPKFKLKGKLLKLMMHNRVNMEDTIVVLNAPSWGSVIYVTAEEDNIRPYGILYKEI